MRVTLLHNPAAGKEEHEGEDLAARLAKAGHKVTYRSTKKRGWKEALARKTDLVLAAGGDGTVGKVARQLAGRATPFSVLPLGTANNLARSLGFDDSTEELIADLENGQRRKFDVGQARGPWGKRLFFEGAGVGLLPDYLGGARNMVAKIPAGHALSRKEEIACHVDLLRRLLSSYEARDWELTVDGEDLSGRFLMIEALNIRSVGPILTLAPDARTDDGWFDLVLAGECDRARLADYLERRLANEEAEFPIRPRRFRSLRLGGGHGLIHIDDKLWPDEEEARGHAGKVEFSVEAGALNVVRPDKR